MTELAAVLTSRLRTLWGPAVEVTAVRPMPGGASRESWDIQVRTPAGHGRGTPPHPAPRRRRPGQAAGQERGRRGGRDDRGAGGRRPRGRTVRPRGGCPRPGLPADGAPGRGDDPAPAAARRRLRRRPPPAGAPPRRGAGPDPPDRSGNAPRAPARRRIGPADRAVPGLRRAPARARDRPALAPRAPARSGRGHPGPRGLPHRQPDDRPRRAARGARLGAHPPRRPAAGPGLAVHQGLAVRLAAPGRRVRLRGTS